MKRTEATRQTKFKMNVPVTDQSFLLATKLPLNPPWLNGGTALESFSTL